MGRRTLGSLTEADFIAHDAREVDRHLDEQDLAEERAEAMEEGAYIEALLRDADDMIREGLV